MTETLFRTVDPYRPAFESIENAPNCTTIEAYNLYCSFVEANGFDPCIYLSMAINSGGYARNKRLSTMEVVARNAAHGDSIADVVVHQYASFGISKSDIIVPSTLGKVEGWGQGDYLLFWAHVICGIEPKDAAIIDEKVRQANVINLPGFSDKTLPRETRWLDYKSLMDEYINQLKTLPRPIHPKNIQSVFLILDEIESLGVNAERYLCHVLGLGEYVFGVKKGIGVAENLRQIRKLGASTLAIGKPHITGRHNLHAALDLRSKGLRFRKSGLIGGIDDRRYAESLPDFKVDKRLSAELWAEYYDSQLVGSVT